MTVRQILRENLAHVRLFEPISANAFARHPRAALAAQLVASGTLGMVLADPAESKACGTFGVRHAGPCSYETRDNPCSALNRW